MKSRRRRRENAGVLLWLGVCAYCIAAWLAIVLLCASLAGCASSLPVRFADGTRDSMRIGYGNAVRFDAAGVTIAPDRDTLAAGERCAVRVSDTVATQIIKAAKEGNR